VKTSLLDVNLLIALAWPSHIHYEQAHAWFADNAAFGWATCPVTQCGFVRVSSNPKIIADAVSPKEALSVLNGIVSMENHVFWPDSIPLSESSYIPANLLIGHRQVTDAYLLGLAISNNGQLATMDKRISSLLPPDSPFLDALETVPLD